MKNGNKTAVMEGPLVEHSTPEAPWQGAGVPTTRPIEALLAQLGPKAVFGEPVQIGETMVIPVAEVRTGFGFGGGQGRRAQPRPAQGQEEGGGSGGGAGARVVPRGYLCVAGTDVRYEPIVDVTRLALAGVALAAWFTYVLSKALKN